MGRAIGIDLGTTNTAVAVMRDGRPRVLEDEKGYNVFPSCISLMDDGSFLLGRSARSLIMTRPDRTVYAAKRLMGRRFDSQQALDAQRRVGYRIEASPDGLCQVVLGEQRMTPVDVSARVLSEVRRLAEAALGEAVDQAVITVPAYFNHAQRQATLEAARIAGLRCERLLNEPTAAALAYGFRRDYDRTILVYDLGGGTFDVSVLQLAAGVYETLSTRGDTYLGGEDFDFRLVDFLADEFQNQHGVDLREDVVALQRLKEAAERAKCELSFTDHTTVMIPRVTASRNLEHRVDRVALERMVEDLINRTLEVTRKAIADAGLQISDIDDVILVGGQTRMPRIREAITGMFQKEPSRGVHPEEVVAIGAAVHASSLVDDQTDAPVLLDVTPFNLGIDIAGGLFRPIITRNTHVPISATQKFVTARENQDLVRVIIRQGESRVAAENEFLGEFTMDGLTPGMNLRTQVEVTFRIDANGMLHVSAVEPSTGERKKVTVRNYAQFAAQSGARPALDLEEEASSAARPPAAAPPPSTTTSRPPPVSAAAAAAAPPAAKAEKKRSFLGALLGWGGKGKDGAAPVAASAATDDGDATAAALVPDEGGVGINIQLPSAPLDGAPISVGTDDESEISVIDELTEPVRERRPVRIGMADSSQSLNPQEAELLDMAVLEALTEADEDAIQLVDDDRSPARTPPLRATPAPAPADDLALDELVDDELFQFEMPPEELLQDLGGRDTGQALLDDEFDLSDLGELIEAAVEAAEPQPEADPFASEDLADDLGGLPIDITEEFDETPTRVGAAPTPAAPPSASDELDFDLSDLGLPELEGGGEDVHTVTDQSLLDDLGFSLDDLDDLEGPDFSDEELDEPGTSATRMAPRPTAPPAPAPAPAAFDGDGLDFDLSDLDALIAQESPIFSQAEADAFVSGDAAVPQEDMDFDLGDLDDLLQDPAPASEPAPAPAAASALGGSGTEDLGGDFDLGDLGDFGDLDDLFQPPPELAAEPIAEPEPAPEPERRSRRKPARLKLAYRDLDAMVAEYRENLRRGSCVVATPKPLPVGRECRITVQAPGLAAPLELAGVVTWSSATAANGSEPGMGIEYVLNEQERRTLEQVLSAL